MSRCYSALPERTGTGICQKKSCPASLITRGVSPLRYWGRALLLCSVEYSVGRAVLNRGRNKPDGTVGHEDVDPARVHSAPHLFRLGCVQIFRSTQFFDFGTSLGGLRCFRILLWHDVFLFVVAAHPLPLLNAEQRLVTGLREAILLLTERIRPCLVPILVFRSAREDALASQKVGEGLD